jgi:hypothetical protein
MTKDFDFDLNHYSVSDLKRLLGLGTGSYSSGDLDIGFRAVIDRLDGVPGVDSRFRSEFIAFLERGRGVLLEAIAPSALPEEIVRSDAAALYKKPIVSKPDVPFVYSRSSEHFGGVLNPLERHLSVRLVSIDSLFRPAGSAVGDFVFKMPEPIKQVASLELMSLDLPVGSLYDVSASYGNNSFYLTVSGDSFSIVVPDGIYTPTSLCSALNKALQGMDISAVSFSLDPASNRLSVDPSGGVVYGLSFCSGPTTGPVPLPLYMGLGWLMGFRQASYTGLTGVLSTEVPVALDGQNYYFIEIDDFNRNNQTNGVMAYRGTDGSYLSNNVLARVSVNELGYQGIVRTHKKRDYFGAVRLEKLRVRLLDRFGRVVDLAGSDWSFLLEIKQVYE